MKNLLNISALLCAAALITACSNEEIMENGTSSDDFTLTATTGANTKTSVDADDYQVTWTAGDAFYAFGGATSTEKVYNATAKFTLTSGEGTANATFSGRLTGSKSDLQYAVYPWGAYTPSTMKVTFPTEYTYPNSNAPMFGKLNSGKTAVNFGQLLSGMMRIKLNGLAQGTEGSLTLAAAGVEGSATLTIDASGNASLTGWANGSTGSVTLNFKKTSDADPLVLDIPVPATTYASGITATLKIGEATGEVFKTTESFNVALRTIKEMPTISDITIDASTNAITFSKLVESAEDAVKALKNGEKNITVNTMAAGEQIEIPSDAGNNPITINVNKVTSDGSFTIKGASGATGLSVSINVPADVEGKLNVEGIDHVEINGTWKEVTASTGDNTFVVKAGAVIEDLTVEQGNIEIEQGGVVNKLTLKKNMTINKSFDIPEGKSMEIVLGTNTLTLPVRPEGTDNFIHIFKGASLTITGDGSSKGKVIDKTQGIALANSNTNFTMTNVEYSADHTHAGGILINLHASNAAVKVENSTMQSVEYCLSTNASAPVGSGNTITFTNSTFTAAETALMVNTPVTVTAENCTFTGGWQGAFLRGGTFTFDGCSFNLNVSTSYGTSKVAVGASSWSSGNNAPAAAITAGNRSGSAYDYPTDITLKGSCSLTVKKDNTDSEDYPAIYLDAEKDKPNQGVTFTDSEASYDTSLDGIGQGFIINNTTGQVKVNGTAYDGIPE